MDTKLQRNKCQSKHHYKTKTIHGRWGVDSICHDRFLARSAMLQSGVSLCLSVCLSHAAKLMNLGSLSFLRRVAQRGVNGQGLPVKLPAPWSDAACKVPPGHWPSPISCPP